MDSTAIWDKYQSRVQWMTKNEIYSKTEQCYRIKEGDQWYGLESGAEMLSQYNFILPLVRYKVAMVVMNTMSITYSPLNGGEQREQFIKACEVLNKYAAEKWELSKMDSKVWEIVNQACTAGDAYLFFYNKNLDSQILDRTNVLLSDEQNPDIQKQKDILVYERRFVDDVKQDARKNGIKEDQINLILPDEDTDQLPDNVKKNEVKSGEKCSCLLYMVKKPLPPPNKNPYGIFIARSTQNVVYQEEVQIEGLTRFPIANFLWSVKRGSARGIGEVEPLINNQINTNKLLARREMNLKMTGFAKPVINMDMIDNPDDTEKVGVTMKMRGVVSKVREAFDYISPSPMSNDAKAMQDEIITVSRDLANAGDNATGNINPEKASGAAILAVKDQQAISNTATTAAYKQFIEDIAAIWLDTLRAYNPDGLSVNIVEGEAFAEELISPEILDELDVSIRIDVSPTNPYSKFAREKSLENALSQKLIAFEEYVEALDDDGSAPKGKFEDIIKKRAEKQQLFDRLEKAESLVQQQGDALSRLMGGMQNEMPQM